MPRLAKLVNGPISFSSSSSLSFSFSWSIASSSLRDKASTTAAQEQSPIMLFVVRQRSTNQSIAQRSETSATGASMAVSTMSMRTSAAEGTDAEAIEAAVEVNTTVA